MSSLGFVLLGALAVVVGALIPVQAATNAAMMRVVGSVAITSLALCAIGLPSQCSHPHRDLVRHRPRVRS
jgi:hypothetical protein